MSPTRKKVLHPSLNFYAGTGVINFRKTLETLVDHNTTQHNTVQRNTTQRHISERNFIHGHFKYNLLYLISFNPKFERSNNHFCRKVAGSNSDAVIRIFH